MKNYYSYLNISELSSTDEIKIAYRRLAQKFHPDRYTGERWSHMFEQLKAYL